MPNQNQIILCGVLMLSMLGWCLVGSASVVGHPLSKRSFHDIECKGVYDRSIFARLDRICEDCYNLFREPQLHALCRRNCFTTDYFKGCLDVLLLQDEMENIQTWIKQLHGADPRSRCFTSKYFKGCIEALLLKEEETKLSQMVEFLGRK